jgi:hypothetical protein
MSEPAPAARPSHRLSFMTADTPSAIDDAIKAVARLSPVRVTGLSIDAHTSTDDTIRVMAELQPAPPQETWWWWSEQISRRVTGLTGSGGSTGPVSFTVHLDVPRDQLEATARALRAAVDEADAALASRYTSDVHARHQLARERQEHERRRFADAQAVLDQVMSE